MANKAADMEAGKPLIQNEEGKGESNNLYQTWEIKIAESLCHTFNSRPKFLQFKWNLKPCFKDKECVL